MKHKILNIKYYFFLQVHASVQGRCDREGRARQGEADKEVPQSPHASGAAAKASIQQEPQKNFGRNLVLEGKDESEEIVFDQKEFAGLHQSSLEEERERDVRERFEFGDMAGAVWENENVQLGQDVEEQVDLELDCKRKLEIGKPYKSLLCIMFIIVNSITMY